MNIELIKKILYQIGWPITLNKNINNILLITEELLEYHEKKINIIIEKELDFYKEYNYSDLYSLYNILEFIIKYLWNDEFHTVIWDNISEWYILLEKLKNYITNY